MDGFPKFQRIATVIGKERTREIIMQYIGFSYFFVFFCFFVFLFWCACVYIIYVFLELWLICICSCMSERERGGLDDNKTVRTVAVAAFILSTVVYPKMKVVILLYNTKLARIVFIHLMIHFPFS